MRVHVGATWRLANTIEPFLCGGDVAFSSNYFGHLSMQCCELTVLCAQKCRYSRNSRKWTRLGWSLHHTNMHTYANIYTLYSRFRHSNDFQNDFFGMQRRANVLRGVPPKKRFINYDCRPYSELWTHQFFFTIHVFASHVRVSGMIWSGATKFCLMLLTCQLMTSLSSVLLNTHVGTVWNCSKDAATPAHGLVFSVSV